MQQNIPTSLNPTGESISIHSNQIPTHSPKFKKNIFLLFFLLVLLVFIIFYIKGSNYINLYNKSNLKTSPSPYSSIGAGCRVGGCSSELCVSKDSENAASICLYSPKFECYKTAVCEIQQSAECGWSQTEELNKCLEKYEKG